MLTDARRAHQAALPGRFTDGWDFVTNVGAAAATAFTLLLLFGAGDRDTAR